MSGICTALRVLQGPGVSQVDRAMGFAVLEQVLISFPLSVLLERVRVHYICSKSPGGC